MEINDNQTNRTLIGSRQRPSLCSANVFTSSLHAFVREVKDYFPFQSHSDGTFYLLGMAWKIFRDHLASYILQGKKKQLTNLTTPIAFKQHTSSLRPKWSVVLHLFIYRKKQCVTFKVYRSFNFLDISVVNAD